MIVFEEFCKNIVGVFVSKIDLIFYLYKIDLIL